jgi:hypothetical protein
MQAMGKPIAYIEAEMVRFIPRITVAEWNCAVPPTAAIGATGKSAIGMNELVIGISLPVGGLATASHDDAGPIHRTPWPRLDCRSQMH